MIVLTVDFIFQRKPDARILLCAPSIVAADVVFKKLLEDIQQRARKSELLKYYDYIQHYCQHLLLNNLVFLKV